MDALVGNFGVSLATNSEHWIKLETHAAFSLRPPLFRGGIREIKRIKGNEIRKKNEGGPGAVQISVIVNTDQRMRISPPADRNDPLLVFPAPVIFGAGKAIYVSPLSIFVHFGNQ